MKRIILSIIILLLSSLILTACNNNQEYSFEDPTFPEGYSENKAPDEEGIVFDGKLDEEFYTLNNSLEFYNRNDLNQKMTLTTVFFDSGLLVGAYVSDSSIYYNNQAEIYKNDSIEFYINPTNQRTTITKDFVQFRVSATNNRETWIGIPTDNEYEWSRYYVPFASAVTVDGTIIDSYAKDIEENHNSSGYSSEIFIPWASLNLDSKPETIDIFPAFVNAHGFGANDFTWNSYKGLFHMEPTNYPIFNEEGYIEAEEGTIFGDSDFGKPYTNGFDISDEENKVIQNGGYDQYLYFKNIKGLTYGFSVDISNLKVLNQDNFPKAGVIIGENSERIVNFFLDPFINFNNYYGVFVPRDRTDDNWQWGPGSPLPNGFSFYDVNTITVVKEEEMSFVFINDILVDRRAHGLNGVTQAGLFTMNMSAVYSNYRSLTENEISAYIESVDFGDSIFDETSNGYSMQEDGTILQNGIGEQKAYFKNVNSSKYLISAKVKLLGDLYGDPFPKVGLIAGSSAEGDEAFLIDPRPNFNIKDFLGISRIKGSDWNWSGKLVWLDNINFSNEIEMTIVRDGNLIYYFVDNTLIYIKESILSSDSRSGLITMNYEAIFSDFTVMTEEYEVDQFLSSYRFENQNGWTGVGNFTILEYSIYLNDSLYDVDRESNQIENESIILEDSFYVEFDLSQLRYAPMDWVWPKISLLLINKEGEVSDIAIGANVAKQNRFETNIDGWLNWDNFGPVDFTGINTVRVERIITQDNQAEFRLFLNGVQATINGTGFIRTNYVDSYHLGLSFDYASGLMNNLNYGQIN